MVMERDVELALSEISKPCTVVDILDHLCLKGICTHDASYHTYRGRIAKLLQRMRSWGVADRLPQGHTIKGNPIWYLVRNGDPHVRPCKICSDVGRAWSRRMCQHFIHSNMRKIRVSPEKDKVDDDQYEGGSYQY